MRELTSATGGVTDIYDYDAFGNLMYRSGTTENVYLYRGERFESDIGQYYLRARFYNQATGRFWNQDVYEGISEDPISLHKYLYAVGNPVTLADPSGRNATLPEVAFTGAAIGLTLALALPSTQRIIRDAGEAAVGLAAELGDSALGRAQQAMAMTVAAGLLAYDSVRDQIDRAERALAEAGRKVIRRLKFIPVSHLITPDIADHVQSVQMGIPQILTRCDPVTARQNRYKAVGRLPPAGPGMSCDEYPFASSYQGGNPLTVSTRAVPAWQNWTQGGIIGACYSIQQIQIGDNFWVVVIP